MKFFLGGIGMLLLWAGLAFVQGAQTGWVHVPLGIGVVLIAVGVVTSDNRPAPGGDGER